MYATRRMKGGHPKRLQVGTSAYRGEGVEKWVIRYVRNKWMVPNKFFVCIGSAKYTRASPPLRKMSLFSSILPTIILFYVIIRI